MENDLRKPLLTILMFMQCLLSHDLEVKANQMLLIMLSQINLILGSINDIFDLRCIVENNFVAKLEAFSPKDTFKFIQDLFQPLMKNHRSEFTYELVPCTQSLDKNGNMPVQLYGDQVRLKQVLINSIRSFLQSQYFLKLHLTASYNYDSEQLKIEITDLEAKGE